MSSFERLNTLREQNKSLLRRLQEQTEKLHSLCPPNTLHTTFSKTDEMVQQRLPLAEKNRDVITNVVIQSNQNLAREALSKLQTQEPPISSTSIIEPLSPEGLQTPASVLNNGQQQQEHHHSDQAEEEPVYTRLLTDHGNIRHTGSRENTTLKSILKQDSFGRDAGRVTFQSPEQGLALSSDRHRLQPLLGYDWIAGILDADSSLTERSEQFFSELRNFRQVNRDECVHSRSTGISGAEVTNSPLMVDESKLQSMHDNHQCTFCYRINSRLFATPLDPQIGCPVCKMPKSKHPHSVSEPAFIRVSIPRSTLLPTYRYKAHRRCSFDPSDSLGLPSHCLSGWSNTAPNTVPHMSSLDLRSSMTSAAGSSSADASLDQSVLGGQRSGDLLDVSRLAHYRFQHFP